MSSHRFTLYLPQTNMCGNLIWQLPANDQEAEELYTVFERISSSGKWCSRFPEGDGFCFAYDETGRLDEESLTEAHHNEAITLFKEVCGPDLLIKPVRRATQITISANVSPEQILCALQTLAAIETDRPITIMLLGRGEVQVQEEGKTATTYLFVDEPLNQYPCSIT